MYGYTYLKDGTKVRVNVSRMTRWQRFSTDLLAGTIGVGFALFCVLLTLLHRPMRVALMQVWQRWKGSHNLNLLSFLREWHGKP